METTGDPRLPNKLQADLWALPAARKCSLSHLSGPNGLLFAVNPFSPELSTERPAPEKPSPNASHRDSVTP